MQTLNNHLAVCPACGLLCDDVNPKNVSCEKSTIFFNQPTGKINAQIKGSIVSHEQAIKAANNILSDAKQPLFAGLSTDINGFRAVNSLVKKTNASLLHMNHSSIQRNMHVLQSIGWQTTTLTEIKNHADLILCIGTDITSHNPRFFERFTNTEGMFAGNNITQREIIYLGAKDVPEASWGISCSEIKLPEALSTLQALLLNKHINLKNLEDVPIAQLQLLADKLKNAKYSVIAWVSKDLSFAHSELTISKIVQIVATLNSTTRSSCISLGGSDGDTSVNYAHSWMNGVIINNETVHNFDALIWINSFSPEKSPPKSQSPVIVIGNPNMQLEHVPDVFIPIATPGLDCLGTLFRVDGSVSLPVKKLRESTLPTLAEVLTQFEIIAK
jgi:formylmethanofuran dehydrogenase subunit B